MVIYTDYQTTDSTEYDWVWHGDRISAHGRGRHYSFSATFRPNFKPTQPHIHCLPGAMEYSFIYLFTLFSVYPYTGKVPRIWKLSKQLYKYLLKIQMSNA